MKKIVSIIISLSFILSAIPVFADAESADKMEEVLITVKDKLIINPELTEFSSNIDNYNGKASYSFHWSDGKNKSLNVVADDKGRIFDYYEYWSIKPTTPLPGFSKAEIIKIAEDFVKRTVPECFSDPTDVLVVDEDSYDINHSRFRVEFVREKDGIPVINNTASVIGYATTEAVVITTFYSHIDYDVEFAKTTQIISNPNEKYREAYPVERVYFDEYAKVRPLSVEEEEDENPSLIFRMSDNGYISASDGSVVEMDANDDIYLKQESATADMAAGAAPNRLTEQEIAEINKIAGLISAKDAGKVFNKLPYIDFDATLKLSGENISKNEDDKYYLSLYYDGGERYFTATLDAKTGEVLNISNHKYDSSEKETELTDAQKTAAEKKIAEFLNKAAPEKIKDTKSNDSECYNKYVYKYYPRVVNDSEYVGNGLAVTFDTVNNIVTSYNMNFSDVTFVSAEGAKSEDEAYEKLLELSPLEKIYVKSGNKFVLCFHMSDEDLRLDAFTLERTNKDFKKVSFKYSDLNGHWSKEAVEKLAEIGIGFDGDTFRPDEAITQADLLRLFIGGIKGSVFLDGDEDELYSWDVVKEEEKNPQGNVKREDAFVYMIRLADLEKIAELSDIYKVTYADSDLLSEGKIGYAAILSGLKVICGKGGWLRPLDNLTRAEAATMLYNYLVVK